MNFKTTIKLLVLLVITVGLCWWLGVFSDARRTQEQQLADDQKTLVAKAQKLMLISPMMQNVDRLEVSMADEKQIVFTREGLDWFMTEPVSSRAISRKVNDLISGFTRALKLETISVGSGDYADMSLADFGLEKPATTISLQGEGRKLSFLVGKNVVASDRTYVKDAGGDEVYIINQNLMEKIQKNINDYRDHQLFNFNKKNVSELVFLEEGGAEFRIAKDQSQTWRFYSPVTGRADKKIIANTVDAIFSLSAADFVEDAPADLSRFGLDKPDWVIKVVQTRPTKTDTQSAEKGSEKIEHILLIGHSASLDSAQVYAKLADKEWVVTITNDSLKKILPDASVWRDKNIVFENADDVTRIDLKRSAQDVMLVKEAGGWDLQADGKFISSDEKVVADLLDAIVGMQASSFIDQPSETLLEKSRIDKPVCMVTLYLKGADGKSEPINIAIGDATPSGMFRYVRREGDSYIAAVASDKLEPIFTDAINYRHKRIAAFGVDTVKSIELKRGKLEYKLIRPAIASPWQMVSPVAAKAEQKNVTNLIMSLATLEAEEFVSKGYLKNYDLDNPEIDVTVNLEVEASVMSVDGVAQSQPVTRLIERELRLAVSEHNGKFYMTRNESDRPLVARISRQVYNDLNAEFIDRYAFGDDRVDPDEAVRLVINPSEKRESEFVKVDGVWTFPADPVVEIDQKKIDQVLRLFSKLKVQRYVTFDQTTKIAKFGLDKPDVTLAVYSDKGVWLLSIGDEVNDGESHYAQSSGRAWVFEISNPVVEALDVTLDDLVKDQVNAEPLLAP